MGNCMRRKARDGRQYQIKEEDDSYKGSAPRKSSNQVDGKQPQQQQQQNLKGENTATRPANAPVESGESKAPNSHVLQRTIPKGKQSNIIASATSKPKAWDLRRQNKDFNMDNFRFVKRKGETLVKTAGVRAQSFMVDQCENCHIYILESIATLTIDECVNCDIIIGACTSSVFVRTMTNCRLQIACGQFRARDCTDCTILLFCRSQPVIESSRNLHFGCFQVAYPALGAQLADCGLNVWKNNWSDLYDFTPYQNGGRKNYDLLPPDFDGTHFIRAPAGTNLDAAFDFSGSQSSPSALQYRDGQHGAHQKHQQSAPPQPHQNDSQDDIIVLSSSSDIVIVDDQQCEGVQQQQQQQQQVPRTNTIAPPPPYPVPLSYGLREVPLGVAQHALLALQFAGPDAFASLVPYFNARALAREDASPVLLRRSTVVQRLAPEQCAEVGLPAPTPNSVTGKPILFLEILAKDAQQAVKDVLAQCSAGGGASANLLVHAWDGQVALDYAKLLFENWNDERHN